MKRWIQSLALLAACAATSSHTDAADAVLRVHLAGDSTMSDKLPEKRPETGWGEPFAGLFRPGTVWVVNHARNGRSTRSFSEEGRWDALLASASEGDYVLLQFGHNDASEHKPDRYTPIGQYQDNLRRFVTEAQARGLHPVLLTPIARRRFDGDGVLQPSHGDYPHAVRALAGELDVPLVDAERITSALLQTAGASVSRHDFLHLAPGTHPNYPEGLQDDTHLSPPGAARVAQAVADELHRQAHPLAALLQAKAR